VGGISYMAFTSDGRRLACGCGDGAVMVWNTSVGASLASTTAHSGEVTGLAWVERLAQRTLVSTGKDSAVKVWFEKRSASGVTLEQAWCNDWLKSLPLSVSVCSTAHSMFIAHSNGKVTVWDVSSPQLDVVQTHEFLAHDVGATSVQVSRGGDLLVTGGKDATAKLWQKNEEDGTWKGVALQRSTGHAAPITSVEFSHTARDFVSASDDGTAIVWNVERREPKFRVVAHDGAVLCATFLGDSALVTGAKDKTIMVRLKGFLFVSFLPLW